MAEKQPLISILTPTYNHENFIGQCIESVLVQTYPNWEQIIIDDGSTDKTSEIISQYGDKRIKYVRQDNLGIWKLNETYNKALKYSKGELIAILEGDDFWPPNKIERQLTAFNRKEVVLCWGKAAITDNNGKEIAIIPKNLKWYKNRSKEEVLKKLLTNNFIPACTVICRKETLLSIGGFRQPKNVPLVDYPTWLELSLLGELYPINEVLGYWRQHKKQVTRSITATCSSTKYAIDVFSRMPQDLKKSIKINENELLHHYQNLLAVVSFNSGRINLMKRNWKDAKKNFKDAFNKGYIFMKTLALLGLICSYCKIDFELILKILKKQSLDIF